MRIALIAAVAFFATAATPAAAEVVDKGPDHFVLQFQRPLTATPVEAFASLGRIGDWWDSAHTWSGDASNLTLSLEMGGCLCEALADGTTFEHGRVVSLFPDRSVGLNAPLGPLKEMASSAVLVLSWSPLSSGPALAMTFVVRGTGVGAYAEAVDGVMGGQFARWAADVEAASAV